MSACFLTLANLRGINLYLFDGLVLLALLLCSAVISGAEIAFFSLSHKQITQCKNSKGLREKKLLKLLQNPRRLLATILILSDLLNVTFATLSTYLLWKITEGEETSSLLLLAYTIISTTSIVLFGELIPKVYANQNNLHFAKKLTGFLNLAVTVLYPLSGPLLSIGKIFSKGVSRGKYDLSIDELSRALELTTTQETSAGEREILKGVVNFSSLTAKQIMQPRTEIVAVDINMNFHQLMDLVNKSGHSRFPVYKEDRIDKLEGTLCAKDLIPYLEEDEHFQWQNLLRKCLFVPENKKIDALLLEFQEKRMKMAIVVDEYGGTSGLVTLEDAIEEIIGDLPGGEFDRDKVLYEQLDEHTFMFEGKVSLNDFCKIVGVAPTFFEEVKGESESLGGLLLELHGRLPLANEKLSYQKFTFTIIAADPRKIKKVKVEIAAQLDAAVPQVK